MAKKYFECNLPEKAPVWLNAAVYYDFQAMLDAIHARMKKLNDALAMTGLDGGRFSKNAKVLFDNRSNFDAMSASEIAQFVTMMDDGVPVEPRLEWPNATVVVDTDFVTRKEWESLRHFGIGGSDAAIVLGISPYQTATSLYHSKVGTPAKVDDCGSSQWVFDRGHSIENRVIEAFCASSGAKRVPESRMFASKQHPNCTANIDAIVRFSDGRIFVFEAKSTIQDNWNAWSCGKVPAHYVPQTRQYPAVLADDRICGTYIGCLFTDDTVVSGVYIDSKFDENAMKVAFIERDEETEREQLEKESEWFRDYVEMNDVPPMTGAMSNHDHPSAGELQVLRRYTTGNADKSLPVQSWDADEFADFAKQWLKLKDEERTVKKRMEDLAEAAKRVSSSMIETLGSAIEAHINMDDGTYYEVKYAPRSRTEVDVESLRTLLDTVRPLLPAETSRALESCIVVNPESSRVFSIRQKRQKGAVI